MVSESSVRIGHERVFLRLSDPAIGRDGPWSVHAHLSLPNLRADAEVWFGPPPESSMPDFFDALAQEWRGWSGERTWEAYEGGLRLGATIDALGHVSLGVELRERSADGWLVRGDVPLDAGQLDQVARDVRSLLAGLT
ncbi:MAG TPA: DUF6228 family protein [Gaiellaceae bacterium]|nr:DUF6228 family protein [Gaiellaceae bacterium]